MEDISEEERKRCFKQLLKAIMCDNCLGTVGPDMFQCANGHIFCSQCKRGLDKCLTCQDSLKIVKPCRLIRQVIEVFHSGCKNGRGKYLTSDCKKELSPDEMKSFFESLLEVMMCAICLETVRPDMVQCVNGHVYCTQCKGDWNVCPICKKEFTGVEPCALVSKVLAAFPLRCKYKNCGKYLKPNDNHENVCLFQLSECVIQNYN